MKKKTPQGGTRKLRAVLGQTGSVRSSLVASHVAADHDTDLGENTISGSSEHPVFHSATRIVNVMISIHFLGMCFDWSLFLGNSGRSTQTRQGPMLSNYSTVEHLGRGSGSEGAGHGRRWRFLSCWVALCRRGRRRLTSPGQ